MPKRREGKNKARHQPANTLLLPKLGRGDDPNDSMASDDDSNMDNGSVYSFASGRAELVVEDHKDDLNDGCDDGYYDDFEDKLLDAMSTASEKSVKSRILALEAMSKAFRSRFMPEFIEERKITILDILEKAIKKGKGEEQGVAAVLSSVVAITLGLMDDSEFVFNDMTTTLKTAVSDTTMSPAVRAKCATALGVNLFIHGDSRASEEEDLMSTTMDALYGNFSGSCLKGNGVTPTVSPIVSNMHAAALNSWSLLLTVQSTNAVYNFAETLGKKISEVLESPDLELRIVAGETLAIIYEICRESDSHFELQNHDFLLEKLKLLATDSHKSRGKKDRRIQRSSFRDILRGVEEGYSPSEVVKFSSQRLILDSWCRKRQYDAICAVLGSGMNRHLSENDLLRDMFGLGTPVTELGGARPSKFARHMENMAVQKARTKVLSKLRDKRADVLI